MIFISIDFYKSSVLCQEFLDKKGLIIWNEVQKSLTNMEIEKIPYINPQFPYHPPNREEVSISSYKDKLTNTSSSIVQQTIPLVFFFLKRTYSQRKQISLNLQLLSLFLWRKRKDFINLGLLLLLLKF